MQLANVSVFQIKIELSGNLDIVIDDTWSLGVVYHNCNQQEQWRRWSTQRMPLKNKNKNKNKGELDSYSYSRNAMVEMPLK
jgi:hypothetical protein